MQLLAIFSDTFDQLKLFKWIPLVIERFSQANINLRKKSFPWTIITQTAKMFHMYSPTLFFGVVGFHWLQKIKGYSIEELSHNCKKYINERTTPIRFDKLYTDREFQLFDLTHCENGLSDW